MLTREPSVIQVVGYKNSGKTTLICKLLQRLAKAGFQCGTIKHDAHEFEIDHEGTDTAHHWIAGAQIVAITSANKTAVIRRQPAELQDLLKLYEGLDWVIVEGFKGDSYPKIVMLRSLEDLSLLDALDHVTAAAAADEEVRKQAASVCEVPVYGRDQIQEIFEMLTRTSY